ncbi:MAG: PH domain-containing protein [Alphaproteobacteria bacterium]
MGEAPDPIEGEAAASPLQPVEPGYRNVLRLRLALLWIPVIFGAVLLDRALEGSVFHWLPTLGVPLLALVSLATVPQRVHARLAYGLTDRWLRVVRGWLFHTDTIVPLVRVQHIDVRRGPAEKLFGVATLVVHTAGTHNSIVTVPGLSPERAAEIRDVIREHVRTDFQ